MQEPKSASVKIVEHITTPNDGRSYINLHVLAGAGQQGGVVAEGYRPHRPLKSFKGKYIN